MKNIVVTFVGHDKAGLVEQLAQLVLAHQGNWLGSSMSHLAGKFAGIVQVELPEEHLQNFSVAIAELQELTTVIQEGSGPVLAQSAKKLVQLSIVGNDRQGIVEEVTKSLHSVDANIEQFSSILESAPITGQLLFKAQLTVLLAEHSSIEQLTDTIEQLGDDIIIDVE